MAQAENNRFELPLPEAATDTGRRCPGCGAWRWTPFQTAPDRFHGRREPYELVRCSDCTLVWLKDSPPDSEMHLHYGRSYDAAVADAGEEPERWRGRRNTVAALKSGGAVLDVGCNAGAFLASLKSAEWKLYGIEISESVARIARRRTGAEVFVGDVLDASFRAESFDVVTCFHVLEHFARPKQVLLRIREWLKPGGVFYMMVPNIESAGARIFGSYWYALELPRHLCHFSPASLRRLAQSAGMDEVSVTTHRELFFEQSTRYLVDEALRRVGVVRTPMADARNPGLGWRIVRKAFRETVLRGMAPLAGLAGDGESIHAIFRRPTILP